MTETSVTPLPRAPLHAIEIWSNPAAVATRFAAAGVALPPMGRSVQAEGTLLMRFEPAVWLAEGDIAPFAELLGEDGSATPIGGGIVRVRLAGPGWRTLLMEGGVFDAESPEFAPGCTAATIIEHVNVRLHVENADACTAYVPSSYAQALIDFWHEALPLLRG